MYQKTPKMNYFSVKKTNINRDKRLQDTLYRYLKQKRLRTTEIGNSRSSISYYITLMSENDKDRRLLAVIGLPLFQRRSGVPNFISSLCSWNAVNRGSVNCRTEALCTLWTTIFWKKDEAQELSCQLRHLRTSHNKLNQKLIYFWRKKL